MRLFAPNGSRVRSTAAREPSAESLRDAAALIHAWSNSRMAAASPAVQ